jgi:hypothetical protein
MSSKLVISVDSSNSASLVQVNSKGRYKRLLTNSVSFYVPGEPLYTTADEKSYWTAVLDTVQALVATL